ncbi:MAG TPA: hypothetical protein VG652_13065 [Gaiellaceae bacterium]|nr:hypothetical protein [Gaiellaceae bacterium]
MAIRGVRVWLIALAAAGLYVPAVARADAGTDAAVKILGQLTELHVQRFDIFCIPDADLQAFEPPRPGDITVGAARIHGSALYLGRSIICDALLSWYDKPQGATPDMSPALLAALETISGTYGFTLGLKRYPVVECYAARVVWKWVLRSDPGYKVAAAARTYLLDNSYRPPGYKLKSTCTLSKPPLNL